MASRVISEPPKAETESKEEQLTYEHESEQEYYSSDEDVEKNRVGNIPLEWYDDLDYTGYDISGEKVLKLDKNASGMINHILEQTDNPLFNRTIYDEKNNETYTLTNRELQIVNRLLTCKFPNETPGFEAEPDYVPYYSSKKRVLPLTTQLYEPKRRFVPSKYEKQAVLKLVQKIRAGLLQPKKKKIDEPPKPYLLWGSGMEEDDSKMTNNEKWRREEHIPAPKLALPGHEESYHPPEEYLDENRKDFPKLRNVPMYDEFVKERFERCVDLYIATRVTRERLNIDPESLVPKLPKARDLRPFPERLALTYLNPSPVGVKEPKKYSEEVLEKEKLPGVVKIDLSSDGSLLAVVDGKGVFKLFETDSGFCLSTVDFNEIVTGEDIAVGLEFNKSWDVLVVHVGKLCVLLNVSELLHGADEVLRLKCEETLFHSKSAQVVEEEKEETAVSKFSRWSVFSGGKRLDVPLQDEVDEDEEKEEEIKTLKDFQYVKLRIVNPAATEVTKLSWHPKGLYLCTTTNSKSKKSHPQILIHHCRNRRSQRIFGPRHVVSSLDVQDVKFHPRKPQILVATKEFVFLFDLMKKILIKKLGKGSHFTSEICPHPSGDHLISVGHDKTINWFDFDYKSSAFKSLKTQRAARCVAIHKKFPLFAVGVDNGEIEVWHAKVSPNLGENVMLVPLKTLKGHESIDQTGVFSLVWHPTLPWLVSCGIDGRVHLWQNIH
eukprot:snap_masked-scaffold_6-processed-gene-14.2-mRNA-1 protein AED:0.21 eAED:0.24 QI:0/-1/0/1/-1/1/1/0/717